MPQVFKESIVFAQCNLKVFEGSKVLPDPIVGPLKCGPGITNLFEILPQERLPFVKVPGPIGLVGLFQLQFG